MADAVTSTLLENGNRNWAYSFTDESDGTGESGVVKVDGSSNGPLGVVIAGQTFYPGIHIKITEIQYDVQGMGLRIQWDATSARDAVILQGYGRLNYWRQGGLFIPAGLAGATGKIKFTTVGAASGNSYTIYMKGTKGIQQ